MLKKERLFTPGPTPLLPSAQLAMAAAGMHHRTAEFRALYQKALADLKTFIGTQNDVLVLAASGTGAMEAAVSNLTSPGDRVLVATAGKFGERWHGVAKAYGCDIEMVPLAYGDAITAEKVRGKLTPETRVLYMQATESSTGVMHDVESVAGMLRGTDTLLVVDAITGLGTTRLDVDGWGVDIIIGGSQKALMIPPGLAYCAVSERAWQRMESAQSPRYYFDLRKERKAAAKGESAFTPAISLIAGLAAALDYLRAAGEGDLGRGRDLLIANAEACAAMTRAAAEALHLKLFAKARPANALTAIESPAGVDSGAIVKGFREQFAAVVANGQSEMKGKLFRIAHIGFYDYLDTIAAIGALEQVLARVIAPRHVEFGAGLRAAQQVYAKRMVVPKA
jgi:aspartate aminotransferase-like enzyme